MYIVYDCSATGKAKDSKAPFSETFKWPRLMHVSWIVLDSNYKPVEDFDCIIKPDGFVIDEDMAKNAHLEPEDIQKKGENIEDVLKQFNKSIEKVEYVFSHNLAFNENVLAAEYIRQGIDIAMFRKERFCLMHESTYYCKLPSKTGGYKWPSLKELHATCFNTTYTPSNNARADVIAAARCFIKLMKTNQLEDLFEE